MSGSSGSEKKLVVKKVKKKNLYGTKISFSTNDRNRLILKRDKYRFSY